MTRASDPDTTVSDRLSTLLQSLEEAAALVEEIRTNPVLGRLISAFGAMPLEDRDVIVNVIEREVQARRLSRATADVTGQSMHPNPNARLYLRQFDNAPHFRSLLERDEMMIATLQALRVTPILTVPEIHAEWVDATREAFTHVDVSTRAIVQSLLREVLAISEAPPEASPQGTS